MLCSTKFLRLFEREREGFLAMIINVDKICIHHYDSDTKLESSVWKTFRESTGTKGKEMFIYFMDSREIILEHQIKKRRVLWKGKFNYTVSFKRI